MAYAAAAATTNNKRIERTVRGRKNFKDLKSYMWGHSVKIDNTSIERVEEFKYLGTTITNQNSIQEEIKSRLKLGNAYYHSVQNLSSSRLLSKNLKIKICRTVILPVVCMGVKPGR